MADFTPSLAGPIAKFEQGSKHLNSLDLALAPFGDPNAYVVVRESDRVAGQQVWRLDSDVPEIPIDPSLLLGDALHCFRSALDHLIWQLVLVNGEAPGRSNAFPISQTQDKYEASNTRMLRGVSPSAKALIDGFQPWQRGYHGLWALQELNNTDKHRHLYLAVVSVLRTSFVQPGSMNVQPLLSHGPVERSKVLCTLESLEPDVTFTPGFDVAFGQEDPAATGASVMGTMRPIQAKVDEVIHSFAQFFS